MSLILKRKYQLIFLFGNKLRDIIPLGKQELFLGNQLPESNNLHS